MRVLADLVERFESPLVADFQSVYGLRLVTAIRDREIDEVWDLVVWLPEGSAFRSSYEADGDPDKSRRLFGWTVERDYLLAIVNSVRDQTWVVAQAHSKTKIPPIEPIEGPRSVKKKSRGDADAMARSLLTQQQ